MEPRSINERRDGAVVRREVAVLGASAGGVEALRTVVRGLPADIPLALVVVLHLPAGSSSKLPDILSRAGPLEASRAADGERLAIGTIKVAPPDHHVVISDDRLFLLDGPRENGFRPAVDPLFRSAARALGPRAIGVILSGTMDDGVAGLAAIQSFGGATVVQDPRDALAPGMPRAALETITPDHVVTATAMGRLLYEMATTEVQFDSQREPSLVADPMELTPRGVDLACPECGGALQEILVGPMSRFRCRTGHVYSPLTLLESKGNELEGALYAALRALEEESSVAGRLARRANETGASAAARRFETRQGDAAQRADLVREALHSMIAASSEAEDERVTTEPGRVTA